MLYIYIFVVIIYLLLENRETSTTFSWLLVFIFLPFVGVVLYFLFGRGLRRKTKKHFIPQDLVNRLSDTHDQLIKQQKQSADILHNNMSLLKTEN
ncbi:MAG: PLD nuclease N-terminal domain-containing protein [Pseudomonadota bacterium]